MKYCSQLALGIFDKFIYLLNQSSIMEFVVLNHKVTEDHLTTALFVFLVLLLIFSLLKIFGHI